MPAVRWLPVAFNIMNIVVLRRKKGCSGLVTLCQKKLALVVVGFFVIMPGLLLFAGYQIGVAHMKANPDDLTLAVQSELDNQRLVLSEVTQKAEENLDALALRLGKRTFANKTNYGRKKEILCSGQIACVPSPAHQRAATANAHASIARVAMRAAVGGRI